MKLEDFLVLMLPFTIVAGAMLFCGRLQCVKIRKAVCQERYNC